VSRGLPPPIRAAGALVWRSSADGLEFAVVHRPHRQDWSLPKGKLDPEEAWPVAAVREVREETGLSIALGPPLPTQRYEVDGVPKQVRYWVGEPTGTAAFEANSEVDALEWLSLVAARERLSHDTDRAVLAGFVDLFAQEEPQPVDVLVVLRHARAMKRAVWRGKDDERPLDERGEEQAAGLAGLLSAYRVDDIHSSNTRRCIDTVDPYAIARRLSITLEPKVSERGHRHKPDAAAKRIAALLDDGGRTVLCSHRPVLPALLGQAVGNKRGVELIGDGLPPAAMVVIHHLRGTVVAIERHDP
jgi:8-oxo-(d)GTP phosphatase